MHNVEIIELEIKQLREELIDLIAENQKTTDLQVLDLSQKLDKLLNTYNKPGVMINEIS